MVAGMIPSALSLGDGGEFRAPMATGVIGGLIVSTILSLVFVPSLYTVMDGLSRRTADLFGRLLNPGAARPKPASAAHPAAYAVQPKGMSNLSESGSVSR
jgi:HAE1 family hydrophobic/amphiphilic exporter-1